MNVESEPIYWSDGSSLGETPDLFHGNYEGLISIYRAKGERDLGD